VHSSRGTVRAIVSVLSRGFACRMLPHDIPPRQTVYPSVRRQRQDGTWTWCTDALRTEVCRTSERETEPRAAMLDSQSVTTTEKEGAGVCAGKHSNRCNRHLLAGASGLLLSMGVQADGRHDRDGDTRSAHGRGNGSRHGQTVGPHPRQQPFLDMVFEYIIRHSPRRRASPCIAEGLWSLNK